MTDVASSSGRMEGKTHHFAIRVYYADTDAGGMSITPLISILPSGPGPR